MAPETGHPSLYMGHTKPIALLEDLARDAPHDPIVKLEGDELLILRPITPR